MGIFYLWSLPWQDGETLVLKTWLCYVYKYYSSDQLCVNYAEER